jgi:hypothetical protein
MNKMLVLFNNNSNHTVVASIINLGRSVFQSLHYRPSAAVSVVVVKSVRTSSVFAFCFAEEKTEVGGKISEGGDVIVSSLFAVRRFWKQLTLNYSFVVVVYIYRDI